MFNIGFSELMILGVIALIFIGPHQLPEVARTIGRLLNEWKRATSDFQNTITTHLTEEVQTRREDSAEEYAKHIGTPAIPEPEPVADIQLEMPIEDPEKKS